MILAIQALNETYIDHLQDVVETMHRRGSPTIYYYVYPPIPHLGLALNGSHRLASACKLKKRVNFVEKKLDDLFYCCDIGCLPKRTKVRNMVEQMNDWQWDGDIYLVIDGVPRTWDPSRKIITDEDF